MMVKKIIYLLILFIPSLFNGVSANGDLATTHLIWDRQPIRIILPVGVERMVSFPTSVVFNYDPQLLDETQFRVDNVGGTLYLTALEPFDVVRGDIELSDGRMILLDIEADYNADNSHVNVLLREDEEHNLIDEPIGASITGYTALSRFAVQQLYAPERLLTQPPNIERLPMYTTRTVPLYGTGETFAMPLAQWWDGQYYVSAILLRNRTQLPIVPDPRQIRGQWLAATIYPLRTLAPSGHHRDSTTVFLISNQPFNTALKGGPR